MLDRSRASIALMVTLAWWLPHAAAEGGSDRLQPMDIFDLELATDPQISPDGSQVVYVRQFADVKSDQRYSNLWVVDFDGSNHRPLTTGHQNDNTPRWSPDGTRLVYISDKGGSEDAVISHMNIFCHDLHFFLIRIF